MYSTNAKVTGVKLLSEIYIDKGMQLHKLSHLRYVCKIEIHEIKKKLTEKREDSTSLRNPYTNVGEDELRGNYTKVINVLWTYYKINMHFRVEDTRK